jgi:hypothetical protein
MNVPNGKEQIEKETKESIIGAVKTPLGFFVLVVLLVEVIFGITASMSSGSDRTYLIIGMLILIFALVFIVAIMAFYRPTSLYGIPIPTPRKTPSLNRQMLSSLAKSKAKDIVELRKFFGNDILTDKFRIVHGTFTRIPYESQDEAKPIYQKIYRNQTKYQMLPPDTITTLNTVHSLSYFLQEFSKYREQPFTICTDSDALSMYHNNSFLSISGPLSNEFTDVALKETCNKFLRFTIAQEARGNYGVIESISDGKRFMGNPEEAGSDFGIIVKLRNSRDLEKHIFICAGLERQGTSAAVWYLTNCWMQLYRKFGAKEFGVVIKAVREQDNLATIIYSVGT